MRRSNSFLGGLSVEGFLTDYWQKKPLLCRAALPNYQAPLDADELAGLALEDEVESRIVKTKGWELSRGPFSEELFANIGDRDWTLLVQDLDQHVPEVAKLLGLLDFLPKWRIDDVMASFAAAGGSVGPHFDQYDVFLLQVEGSRRWQIAEKFDSTLLEASDLCILSQFTPEQEWVLAPGDMLYLPPRVAHHGVAVTPCVTYSLGCRAPSIADIVRQFAALRVDELDESMRYQGSPVARKRADSEVNSGQLAATTVEELRALLRTHLEPSAEAVTRAFCQLVTEPKALFARATPDELSERELKQVLKQPNFERRKGSRWIWSKLGDRYALYVDGAEWLISAELDGAAGLLDVLCNETTISQTRLSPLLERDGSQGLAELFKELVRRGEMTEARELV